MLDESPSKFPNNYHPVERVSRDDCQRFLDKLNQRIPGLGARLPSEAEWEYACRAGSALPFAGSDHLDETDACFAGAENTATVKSFACNPWGFYDMLGNVREWCRDGYADYLEVPLTDPIGVGDGGVTRGGCWDDGVADCRSARRHHAKPGVRSHWNGLRIAVDAK